MNTLPSPATETIVTPDRLFRPTLYAWAAALIALGVYLLTLAPDLSWANWAVDGAELITASATLGVPHPPGYPTYTLLGKLFSLIPLGTVAFRYNLFSAICTAAAVGLVTMTISALHPRIRPAAIMTAALLFGFAPLVWSQAIVAEVYSLNLLIVAAFLLAWSRRGASVWSGFWLGLAITTHLTSILLLPAYLIRGRRQWRRVGLGLALGLAPLLFLPLLALGDSPAVWGRPTDPTGWWWLVSGRLYAGNFQPLFDVGRLFNLLQAAALGPVAFLAAGRAARITAATETDSAATDSRPTPALLAGTSILYVVFALSYNTPDSAVLLLPVFLLLAVLIAPLLDRLGTAAILLPLILAALTYQARDLSGETQSRALAEAILQSAPKNALLLAPGDRTIFTLLYFQQVEGERPDLRLVDANLFAFDWYRARLEEQYSDMFVPTGDDLIALQRENETNRPFCLVGLVLPPGQGFDTGQFSDQTSGAPPYLYCMKGAQ